MYFRSIINNLCTLRNIINLNIIIKKNFRENNCNSSNVMKILKVKVIVNVEIFWKNILFYHRLCIIQNNIFEREKNIYIYYYEYVLTVKCNIK